MKRWGLAVTTTVVATAVLLASPARADDESAGSTPREQVGVSLDGVHYRDSPQRPLFDADVTWAPGDVRTSRFFVRRTADKALTVVVDGGEVADLFHDGALTVAARVGEGDWRDLSSEQLVRLGVPADEKVPVSVRVTLAADAPREASVRSSDFHVDVAVGDLPEASRIGDGERNTWWVVPMGLLLLSGGAVLYSRRDAERPIPGRVE